MKLFFESALPRAGGQLFKNILVQNINLSVQSDSPLHYKFFQFRDEFNKDSMVSTFDSKDLEDRFKSFWNAGMRAWGKEINKNSKVHIDSFRFWIDDIDGEFLTDYVVGRPNGGEDIRGLRYACNYLVTPETPNEDTPRVQELQLRWVHDLSGLVKGKLANA